VLEHLGEASLFLVYDAIEFEIGGRWRVGCLGIHG
jgi:hypothetical protein